MKYVIMCPYGVRTGGPEACFQLSDSLIKNGFNAELWLITNPDLEVLAQALRNNIDISKVNINVVEKNNQIDDYKSYRYKPFRTLESSEPAAFVLPETYLFLLPLLKRHNVVVWWLSVDNALGPLAQINLNWLRLPNVYHAVQSAYAMQFASALGLEPFYLTDYTQINRKIFCSESNLTDRPPKITINAGRKVIFDLNQLARLIQDQCPQVEIVKIVGMSHDQVISEFRSCRVFIDIGNFPGKDRMAREALAEGANVIVGSGGSGYYEADYPIPSLYRPKPFDLTAISRLAVHMLLNPEVHFKQFDTARKTIANEQKVFNREVLLGFSRFL